MRFTEINLYGVYVAPISVLLVAAWVVTIALRRLVARAFPPARSLLHRAVLEPPPSLWKLALRTRRPAGPLTALQHGLPRLPA